MKGEIIIQKLKKVTVFHNFLWEAILGSLYFWNVTVLCKITKNSIPIMHKDRSFLLY